MYKTTDIDVRHAPDMLAFCNDALAVAIVPTLAACFQIEESDMEVDDLFVVKYQYAKNGADGHDQESRVALAPHRDDSVLSFVIPLNTMGEDFADGGTEFVDWQPSPLVAAPPLAVRAVALSSLV